MKIKDTGLDNASRRRYPSPSVGQTVCNGQGKGKGKGISTNEGPGGPKGATGSRLVGTKDALQSFADLGCPLYLAGVCT
ncbi:uncharacterized protein SPSK_08207 [Sporothrix schenckii 1099-18]|uniref:Uncharacterized protein n=1 Tax=Sporothrix schenckii 1099-18 TaxID=1397361 RepID=A0A0F2MGE7_SPOSC|nr:uncharacterized protein SPSK_08207 [Sporothrix schenckii 1099-18]KJR88697.1 hypothetical protein SPSK_08207 [Sporothrix schenckii 1099-18]